MLRSASKWSAGIDEIEASIHACMVQVISEAQHYVYIENQFFISSASGGTETGAEVKNSVCSAILQRIIKAHKLVSLYLVRPSVGVE